VSWKDARDNVELKYMQRLEGHSQVLGLYLQRNGKCLEEVQPTRGIIKPASSGCCEETGWEVEGGGRGGEPSETNSDKGGKSERLREVPLSDVRMDWGFGMQRDMSEKKKK
jgi:hypothetical protein